MRWKEKLYERPLKRPIDEHTRAAIHSELNRRRGQFPIAAELSWNTAKPELTIRAKWISFVVNFTQSAWWSTPSSPSRPRCLPPKRTVVTLSNSLKASPTTSTFERRAFPASYIYPGTTTMAHEKKPPSAHKRDLDLRFKASDQPLDPNAKRFDIFLIDTGWNAAVAKLVHVRLATMFSIEREDSFYVLTPEQSTELMKRNPHLIGHDPIILVYDLHAPANRKSRGYRGFRLNLGLIKHPEQALARLQEFLRFVALNRTAVPLDRAIRRELYREGFDGMIKILREASTELI